MKEMSKEQCCLVCEALMGRLREERCRRREGIFRVPGNAEKIAEAQARLRNFEDPDIVIEDLESEEDFCDACASLLRKWLPMAIDDAESSDADRMFEFLATIADDAGVAWLGAYDAYRAADLLEARIVKAADRIQMLAKAATYENQRRGDVARFFEGDDPDFGIPIVGEILVRLRERRALGEWFDADFD